MNFAGLVAPLASGASGRIRVSTACLLTSLLAGAWAPAALAEAPAPLAGPLAAPVAASAPPVAGAEASSASSTAPGVGPCAPADAAPSLPRAAKAGRELASWPRFRSESVLIRYADTKEILFSKNANTVRPIASITKLLSGLLLTGLQGAPADDAVTILEEDKDRLKWSRSRIRVGTTYRLPDLFAAALGASDNRAMYASVRALGLRRSVFVDRMNALARELGMSRSNFADPAGIDPRNVSTASDLLLLLDAAADSDAVRSRTLLPTIELVDSRDRCLTLPNPDRLVRSGLWDVVVGKTGYTVEAGRSLVLRVLIDDRPIDMVFLGARERASVFGDALRVRRWLEDHPRAELASAGLAPGASPASAAR